MHPLLYIFLALFAFSTPLILLMIFSKFTHKKPRYDYPSALPVSKRQVTKIKR